MTMYIHYNTYNLYSVYVPFGAYSEPKIYSACYDELSVSDRYKVTLNLLIIEKG